jgi:single-strand DNA-binding protein
MAAPLVTVVGRLTADPELRFTPSGAAVVNLTIASNDRYKKDDEWVDKPGVFLRGTLWRDAAENVAESLTKGTEVIATGKLAQRDFENREGVKQTVIEFEIQDIGPSLSRATAKVTKAPKGGSKAAGGSSGAADEPDW